MICKECNGRGETIYYEEINRDENTVTIAQRKSICRTCNGSGETPMTNADKIRAMTDEELAGEMFVGMECGACPCADKCGHGANCRGTILDWLKQPAEDDC